MAQPGGFPLDFQTTLADLECDPHPLLARLREREPVSWLPALGAWLVTRLDRDRPAAIPGLVFRKPPELHAAWEQPATEPATR
jgi:hypothetical protein